VPGPDIESYAVREIPLPEGQRSPQMVWIGTDGMVWTTNKASNSLSRLDPKSGAFRTWTIPTPESGLVGLTVDYNNRVWFTEMDANKIGMLDATTEQFQEWQLPTAGAQPSSLIADGNGTWVTAPPRASAIWFTEPGANQVGHLDLATNQISEYPVPTADSGVDAIAWGPDGLAIFAEPGSFKLGAVTPDTHDVQEASIPLDGQGAGRVVTDASDRIWITSPSGGVLGLLSYRTGTWVTGPPPTQRSQPYGLTIDRWGYAWFTELDPDQIARYDPTGAQFREWPLPPNAGCRALATDANGGIWCAASGRDSLIVFAPAS
jgi:virginiamycin B lyase